MLMGKDVGDLVDFYCSRCRLNLNGTVMALGTEGEVVKVTCRTCQSGQPYKEMVTREQIKARRIKQALAIRDRRTSLSAGATEPEKPSAAAPQDVTSRWRVATEDVDARYAPRHVPELSLEAGDLLLHAEHGLGIVSQVIHENAALVLFRKVEVPLEMNRPPEED